MPEERKALNLRVDPRLHVALSRWAADEFRSANAQAEKVLWEAVRRAGYLPRTAASPEPPRRGRPPKADSTTTDDADTIQGGAS